ncbi:hypothetical protein D9613_007458 [Agrocybe pediades]|uniref:F-box domain-containing protein n=1 Tax=Agrocybe pediades TaxID=84607 RepID=A0A8H4QNP6_9AGAR|nr:hypothetical protein D9613_007458 [Agrocybe pediades]
MLPFEESQRLLDECRSLRQVNAILATENVQLKAEVKQLQHELDALNMHAGTREKERLRLLGDFRVVDYRRHCTTGVYIPQELTDHIMAYLDPLRDKNTLLRCGLVCRAWVPSSRKATFESLTFSAFSTHAHRLQFFGVLDHPLCTFSSSVKTLILDGKITEDLADLGPIGWLDPLLPLLWRLDSVKELHGTRVPLSLRTEVAWRALLRAPNFTSKIVKLTLVDVKFDSVDAFAETVRAFPHLEHLTYDPKNYDGVRQSNLQGRIRIFSSFPLPDQTVSHNVQSDSSPMESNSRNIYEKAILPGPKPLQELRILDIKLALFDWCYPLWDWLLQNQVRPSEMILDAVKMSHVQSVISYVTSKRSMQHFSSYLQFAGPYLETLKVDFGRDDPKANDPTAGIRLFLEHVKMSPVSRLIHLEITPLQVCLLPDDLRIELGSLALPNFISTLAPHQRRLEHIAFNVVELRYYTKSRYASQEQATLQSSEAWEVLDRTLAGGKHLVTLQRLVFRLPTWERGSYKEDFTRMLENKLPWCFGGRLEVKII